MAPTGEAYEADWILSNSSNAHVATHRDWFTSITPFDTSIYCSFPTDRCRVMGIGEVHLEVKTDPTSTGSRSHKTLILHDVLYCPDLASNILGGHIHDDFPLGEATTRLVDLNGEVGCVFDRVEIKEPGFRKEYKSKVWLEGHRQGYFSEGSGLPWKQAIWPGDEMQRWEDYKAVYDWSMTVHSMSAPTTLPEAGKPKLLVRAFSVKQRKIRKPRPRTPQTESCASSLVADGVTKPPPYTQEEKDWLREHYGEDFRFNGLSLNEDAAYSDGRRTMSLTRHSMMRKDTNRVGSLRSRGMHRVSSIFGSLVRI
ncbi:hypothetical protein CLAFUW4_12767 [Fulvia fulva]|uniref:Retrovirus-related Pol polyprotein from transposon TNT 1-94-like beta-barrel domain-containing protein n=1 Tax=Passalora fulva TaxID=5499 RepID=A0A9Q8PKB8_PASFU|nr:uncharacterized protein CLAFUR5_12633 [Fulvia fulva]KAK4612149.1 hypothetical protein CLAFUR4_12771 [Fulvia fulva]KAK4612389.1 hypothetical protein CLAFUR0_12777 [Fulvia fulva]UJO24005.1 hypothetical protein CLAFUR5_12633 [Fulvia fulva]WPV21539.1 hypothetical protein CLAFUW4_12767 [Fulvia fulva]WPV36580.1 hypothetical protein CLAFUW7_12774 [Fulvia fulva]